MRMGSRLQFFVLAFAAIGLGAVGATHFLKTTRGPAGAVEVDSAEAEIFSTLALKKEDMSVPADPSNRFADDPQAAEFGRKLFSDPRFSGRLIEGDNDGSTHTLGKKGEVGKVACSGCHMPTHGFSDFRTLGGQISLAAGWGKRRAPSLLDVAQNRLFMWDGSRDNLAAQIFAVIESPTEMNSSRLFYAQKIDEFYRAEYKSIFGSIPHFSNPREFSQISPQEVGCHFQGRDAIGDCLGPQRGAPGDQAEFDHLSPAQQDGVTQAVINAGKAIAAYERTLHCGRSRFDEWVAGNSAALSSAEQRGAKLFVGKAKCMTCHSGRYFSDFDFHNVGVAPTQVAVVFLDGNDHGAAQGFAAAMRDPLSSHGRFLDGDRAILPVTVDLRLEGAFKTPMLRCLSSRPSYLHTGQLRTLRSLVDFLNAGGSRYGYPGKNELKPLGMSEDEQADLIAFLLSLDTLSEPTGRF